VWTVVCVCVCVWGQREWSHSFIHSFVGALRAVGRRSPSALACTYVERPAAVADDDAPAVVGAVAYKEGAEEVAAPDKKKRKGKSGGGKKGRRGTASDWVGARQLHQHCQAQGLAIRIRNDQSSVTTPRHLEEPPPRPSFDALGEGWVPSMHEGGGESLHLMSCIHQ